MDASYLRVLDNFLDESDAMELRAMALRARYTPWRGRDGRANNAVPHVARLKLDPLVLRLNSVLDTEIKVVESGFRYDLDGEKPNYLVHFDEDVASHAIVFYLNTPSQCRGGTAFWMHRATGMLGCPRGSAAIDAGFRADGNNEDAWILHSCIGMGWNRCIIYPGNVFHSRWPFEGFGQGPRDGRLVAGIFFNAEGA